MLVTMKNSLVNGAPPGRLWGELDFSKAWIDPGPSPAGNGGPYLKAPHVSDGTIHRVYPKRAGYEPVNKDGVWYWEATA